MAGQTTPLNPVADRKLPTVDPNRERQWALYYHFGTNVPNMKVFSFPGVLQAAKARAIKHCEIMGYRFIKVVPFLVDLDHQEAMKLAGSSNPDYD